jgi:hypothetical protein
MWNPLINLSRYVLSCTNNVIPFRDSCFLPDTIDSLALNELDLSAPPPFLNTIRFPNVFNFLTASSLDELFDAWMAYVSTLTGLILQVALWILKSVLQGTEAKCNWGAYFGMDWISFLKRISPSTLRLIAEEQGLTFTEIVDHYRTDYEGALGLYHPSHSPISLDYGFSFSFEDFSILPIYYDHPTAPPPSPASSYSSPSSTPLLTPVDSPIIGHTQDLWSVFDSEDDGDTVMGDSECSWTDFESSEEDMEEAEVVELINAFSSLDLY